MGVHIRRKRNKLYLDIITGRTHRWQALGLTLTGIKAQDKEIWRQAEIIKSKKEIQIVTGQYDLVDPIGSKMTLIDYARMNAQGRDKKDHLPKSIKYLERYKDGGQIQLGSVTAKWLENYRDWLLKETGLSQGTAGHYYSTVRALLKLALRDRLILADPALQVRGIPIPESTKQPLTIQEVQRIANTPIGGKLGNEVKKAFLFACCTGLRISDLKSLKWGKIEQRTDGTRWLKTAQQKTGKLVTVPLHLTAWKMIKTNAVHSPDDFVFPLLAKTKTDPANYIRPLSARAGIPESKHVSMHTARHTYATLVNETGANAITTMKLLGHTKINNTLVYAEAGESEKAAVVNALPDIDLTAAQGNGSSA